MRSETLHEQIRELFRREGGLMSTRRLAKLVLPSGIYTDEQLAEMQIRGIQADCRRALTSCDAWGRPTAIALAPKAGADSDDNEGEPEQGRLWQDLVACDKAQIAYSILERCTGIDRDYSAMLKLVDYSIERFGTAPAIPELIYPPADRRRPRRKSTKPDAPRPQAVQVL